MPVPTEYNHEREYPRWIFSPRLPEGMIVNSFEHEQEQGPGWYDSPAEFPMGQEDSPEAEGCPTCAAYEKRVAQLEAQIVEMEREKG